MTGSEVEDYLLAWGHRLALCEWELGFRVHEGSMTPKGWAAETTIDHECLKADIDLAGALEETRQKESLRHELLHLNNAPLERLFREAMAMLSPQVGEVLNKLWDTAEEHHVRHLSQALTATLEKGEPKP